MNLYFLLEGKRTEPKIYPKWLSHLLPHYSRVFSLQNIKNNNYILLSGMGYPSILNHIRNSIDDVRRFPSIDYLIISVDCDDDTPAERYAKIENRVDEFRNGLDRSRIIILLQNRCIETWLLGNRKIFKHNPQDNDLTKYIACYNVKDKDPELMGNYDSFNSISQFHAVYLKKPLRENNIPYTKTNPSDTAEGYYLEQLIKRINDTGDLKSFRFFVETIERFK